MLSTVLNTTGAVVDQMPSYRRSARSRLFPVGVRKYAKTHATSFWSTVPCKEVEVRVRARHWEDADRHGPRVPAVDRDCDVGLDPHGVPGEGHVVEVFEDPH